MKKGMELNKNIGSKSLHHFVQRLLVPSVRQQVGKPQVLMTSQQNCSKQEERQHWTESTEYVWRSGKWEEEWTFSTFIPLPKKGDLKNCGNYRTIDMISHASKTLLRIILEKIRVKTETEIADEQAGFRQRRGTRYKIMNLRMLMQKARGHQQPLYMCFVDFKKAFDSISHDKLWVTMMDMGYPLHLIDLLAKLYRKQLPKVKVAGTLSEWFPVKKRVQQGCVLFSYLFNILVEMVMRETLDGFQGGVQIGGRMITNLRYADDIIM